MANRPKMDRSDRAKQFMPFDAVKGLQEALREKERIIVPKVELAEDYREELDRITRMLKVTDMVTVIYFHDSEYVQITGLVSMINENAGYLQIVNTKIDFKDIFKIIL